MVVRAVDIPAVMMAGRALEPVAEAAATGAAFVALHDAVWSHPTVRALPFATRSASWPRQQDAPHEISPRHRCVSVFRRRAGGGPAGRHAGRAAERRRTH